MSKGMQIQAFESPIFLLGSIFLEKYVHLK